MGWGSQACIIVLVAAGALAGCGAAPVSIRTRVLRCPAEVAGKERPAPAVALTTRCTYYEVRGETAEELRQFMNAWGPSDESGVYDGYTAYALRYGYHHAQGEAGCAMREPIVELYVMHILPAWPDASGKEPGLPERWRRYTRRLSVHERGHADISVLAANELARAFAALPPAPTCDALRGVAHGHFEDAVARLKAKHRRYDRRTWHGATQGSVFP